VLLQSALCITLHIKALWCISRHCCCYHYCCHYWRCACARVTHAKRGNCTLAHPAFQKLLLCAMAVSKDCARFSFIVHCTRVAAPTAPLLLLLLCHCCCCYYDTARALWLLSAAVTLSSSSGCSMASSSSSTSRVKRYSTCRTATTNTIKAAMQAAVKLSSARGCW
jgi:hypothetical protein